VQSVSTSAKASIATPIARFAMNKLSSAPHPFEFSKGHPIGLSPVDVDIIKLTAQYTAANGREFLGGLALREQRNPQFDFLKPTHMLFSYFTSLVDDYAKVLQPSGEQIERVILKKDRMKALESAVHRWEWNRSEEERKTKESKYADEERSAFQSIDWFDFTVVETIDFAEDEQFVPATGLEGTEGGQSQRLLPEDDDDMDMDEDDDHPQTVSPRMEMPMPPPPSRNGFAEPNGVAHLSSSSAIASNDDEEMYEIEGDEGNADIYGGEVDVEMEPEPEVNINVVTDYTPRMAGTTAGPMTMVDPVSGKVIPVDEMSEHMRIQLMDPRYRIEQKRFQDKQRETGYAEGGSIADSLMKFAKKRGDIFGEKDESSSSSQEEERKKADSVQWDGHMASIPQMQQMKNDIAARTPQTIATAASTLPAIGPVIPGLGPQIIQSQITANPTPPAAAPPVPTQPISLPNYPVGYAPAPTPSITAPIPTILPPIPTEAVPEPIIVAQITESISETTEISPEPITEAMIETVTEENIVEAESEQIEPVGKKARIEQSVPLEMVSAEEFALRYPEPITITAQTPVDSSVPSWGLAGQTVAVTVCVKTTIKKLKEEFTSVLGGMPGSKQQLKATTGGGFFKDTQTLAGLNIGEGGIIELSVKTRGGGKK
jgi:splicing factor 3A subunit 1